MGLLDSVTTALGDNSKSDLMSLVMGLMTDQNSGGLAGLLQKFQEKGLGNLAASWVGKGPNLPLSADQIQGVLGSAPIQQMAAKAGISPETLSGKLADLLPQLVDRATPDGSLPDAGSLSKNLGGLLQGFLGSR